MQGDQPDSIMNEKATNDAAAFIRTISEKRHRNARWAEKAVRRSISYTETEARRDSVIDLIAPTLTALLDSLDGRSVDIHGNRTTLQTAGATVVEIEMGVKYEILNILSDPNIAYIFLLLGIYGLMFELYNPGSVLPGVVGAISIVIAFYSLNTLPVNYAGLALIGIGIVLFILEIKITSYGLLTLGGLVALFLGSIMLIDSGSPWEVASISWSIIIPAVFLTAAFFVLALGLGIRAQRGRPRSGIEAMVGERGEAITELNPSGQVRIRGEIWNASSASGRIRRGVTVVVERVSNLVLTVRGDDR
jgi:membrane-bound serine protease (ClpP class)